MATQTTQVQQTTQKFFKMPQRLAARTDLTPADKLVYAVIADRLGHNGYSWPSYKTIAADAGLSRRGAQGSVYRLRTAGLLLVEEAGTGRGRTNHYALSAPADPQTPQEADVKSAEIAPFTLERAHGVRGKGPTLSAHNLRPNQTTEEETKKKKKKKGRESKKTPKVVFDEATATFAVAEDLLTRWRGKYPGVNLDREILNAGEWQAANAGGKAWKPKGYQRGLVNWLNGAITPRPGFGGGNPAGRGRRPARIVPSAVGDHEADADYSEYQAERSVAG